MRDQHFINYFPIWMFSFNTICLPHPSHSFFLFLLNLTLKSTKSNTPFAGPSDTLQSWTRTAASREVSLGADVLNCYCSSPHNLIVRNSSSEGRLGSIYLSDRLQGFLVETHQSRILWCHSLWPGNTVLELSTQKPFPRRAKPSNKFWCQPSERQHHI